MKNFFARKTAPVAKAAEKAIYEQIKQAIGPDGRLPQNFHLGPEPQPGQIGFAPGAMDGIVLYHSGGGADAALLADLQRLTQQVRLVSSRAALISGAGMGPMAEICTAG